MVTFAFTFFVGFHAQFPGRQLYSISNAGLQSLLRIAHDDPATLSRAPVHWKSTPCPATTALSPLCLV